MKNKISYIYLRLHHKVLIATFVTSVKTQDKQTFGCNREVGYVDQHKAADRDAVKNVTSTASVTNLRRYCGRSTVH
jgi:hypothetical protein